MTDINLYRADGRSLAELQGSGFAPRRVLTLREIQDKLDGDVKKWSREIIDAGRAEYWTSMGNDENCKGQIKGNAVYSVTLDLKIFKVSENNRAVELAEALGGENALLNCWMPKKDPHLVLDTTDIATATQIGLLHGQSGEDGGTCEISFFRTIAGNLIQQHAAA